MIWCTLAGRSRGIAKTSAVVQAIPLLLYGAGVVVKSDQCAWTQLETERSVRTHTSGLWANYSTSASMSKYKVYTKTGDKGESSLYNGERRQKDNFVFAALGDTDELNSAIGVAREFCLEENNGVAIQLADIQSRLLDVGSAVATPQDTSSDRKKNRVAFDEFHVVQLESWIDSMDEELPQLTTFILPSGGKAASFLHMARTICRRAERAVVPLVQSEQTDEVVGRYLNRLSDYLFTAARFAAMKAGAEETTYKKA